MNNEQLLDHVITFGKNQEIIINKIKIIMYQMDIMNNTIQTLSKSIRNIPNLNDNIEMDTLPIKKRKSLKSKVNNEK